MEHEKISPPANAQQVNSGQGDLPEDANAGDDGAPSNDNVSGSPYFLLLFVFVPLM